MEGTQHGKTGHHAQASAASVTSSGREHARDQNRKEKERTAHV